MTSQAANAVRKSSRDQRARFLRAHVVGVVVAARERIRADEDAALDFVAEPRGARGFVGLPDVARLDAQTVAHAVEAREVRRTLRRRDQIVGRDAVIGGRQIRPRRVRRPSRSKSRVGAFVDRAHVRLERAEPELAHDADANAAQVRPQAGRGRRPPVRRRSWHPSGLCPPSRRTRARRLRRCARSARSDRGSTRTRSSRSARRDRRSA